MHLANPLSIWEDTEKADVQMIPLRANQWLTLNSVIQLWTRNPTPSPIDLSAVQFASPGGLVTLLAALQFGYGPVDGWPPKGRDVTNYLSRMKVDQVLQRWSPNTPRLPTVRKNPADLLELCTFEKNELDQLTDLVEKKATDARLPTEWVAAISEGLWEIGDNVHFHARSPHPGVMAAQHYPSRDEIELAVADIGIGIRESLRGVLATESDAAAIIKAAEYGVTRFGYNERGAGLAETIESTTQQRGQVAIVSGRAKVDFKHSGNEYTELVSAIPGTIVVVRLKVNS